MGFASGSISFRRFAIVGNSPDSIDQDLLDKLASHALKVSEFGVPEAIEYGWSGGRHLLDGQFSFENNVFADAVHFALRIDTNRVPSELKRAYAIMEEEAVAATNPSGFISKNQKQDVKEIVRQKLDEELRTGKFRRSKLFPVLWDVPQQMLYCAAGTSVIDQLMELFERTFELTLMPLSAGSLAQRLLERKARKRDYEDARPTRFVPSLEGDTEMPEYPWVMKGPEPKDFLGNEFLLWLWHETQDGSGVISIDGEEASILFERSLELECAYGQTGKATLKSTVPTQMPEAKSALRTGKVPRKAGLTVDLKSGQFTMGLNPETLAISGLKLPNVDDAETPRALFEARINLLRDYLRGLNDLYELFLKKRVSSGWEGEAGKVRKWIQANKNLPALV